MASETEVAEQVAVFVAQDIADVLDRATEWVVDRYDEWNPVSITFDWDEAAGWAATVVLGP